MSQFLILPRNGLQRRAARKNEDPLCRAGPDRRSGIARPSCRTTIRIAEILSSKLRNLAMSIRARASGLACSCRCRRCLQLRSAFREVSYASNELFDSLTAAVRRRNDAGDVVALGGHATIKNSQ